MKTELITENLQRAADLLRRGGLVSVPTETVYGLAGNGLDEEAVKNIYEVKGRPAIKPLSLMVPGAEAMDKYCVNIPETAYTLAKHFWPGPLTIVLESRPEVPEIVRAGGKTVGLRCPDHPLTLETLRLAGIPLAAPSANPSGEESPKNAQKVLEYFDGKIDAVIDGGECGIGTESTLILMTGTPYKILRRGALSEDEIADALVSEMDTVGITGGSGSGKTTALLAMKKRGALIIDCDEVYHRLLSENAEMLGSIAESFPGTVVDGVLQRQMLGGIVFSDAAKLEKLNDITCRYVCNEVVRMLREWAMNGGKCAAIDAVNLISARLTQLCRLTVGVVAEPSVRIKRIVQRDNISEEYAAMRLAAQRPDSYYYDNCDAVIENNGDIFEFEEKFNRILEDRFNG